MLVLLRKTSESIVFTCPTGERVVLTVLGADSGRVRIGVEAPRSVEVNRSEVQEEIDRERAAGRRP